MALQFLRTNPGNAGKLLERMKMLDYKTIKRVISLTPKCHASRGTAL